MKILFCSLFAAATALINCTAIASTDGAKALFEKYVEAQHNYDSAIKDLYSDSAVLIMVAQFPDGSSRTNKIPATTFKRMIEGGMQEAKRKGDTDAYSETTFNEEKGKVRIATKCTSQTAKRTKTISLLVEQLEAGKWQITEESAVSEAKPFLDQKKILQPKQEWVREVTCKKAGPLVFKVSGSGPFSVTILTDAAYQALVQKDTATLRKHGMVLSKDSSEPELVNAIRVEPGNYHFILRNGKTVGSELRLQCYGVGGL